MGPSDLEDCQQVLGTYAFDPADDKLLHLSGMFQGREVRFDLERIDPDEYPLQSRRFRWISEFPFNR
jgi:hypothetical protein